MKVYLLTALTFFLSLSLYGQGLQILTPNGGEEFQAGTEVLITWAGVSENDTVSIEFSSDIGDTWEALTEDATGNEYKWNAPQLGSDQCLIRITQIVDTSIKEGDILWEKSFGGSGFDEATSIQQTLDGGYIVAGYSNSQDGDITDPKGSSDYWILKLKKDGSLDWQKSYGGSHDDEATSIQQTLDGGYIVAGSSSSQDGDITDPKGNSDFWILKLDANGIIEWQKSYGGSHDDEPASIQQTLDEGYIIAGYSRSTNGDITEPRGYYDYWILKLNKDGSKEWQKSYGGSFYSEWDKATSIQQTIDGGYIVAGFSESSEGDISYPRGGSDYWILKLNSNGNMEWERSYGGSKGDGAKSIQQTIDGGYIVAGSSNSTDGDLSKNIGGVDYWILKLNSNGYIEWQKSYGGRDHDIATSIQQTIDEGYIVAGNSRSWGGDKTDTKGGGDYWILKLKNDGSLDWQKSYGGRSLDKAYSIKQTSDDGYIVAGWSRSTDGDIANPKGKFYYWIVKIAGANITLSDTISDTSDSPFSIIYEEEDENEPDTSYSFDFYISPNATSDEATINLELQEEMDIELIMYDNLGRKMLEIFNGTASEGIKTFEVDLSSFSSARYYIRLITPEQTKTKIIELLK